MRPEILAKLFSFETMECGVVAQDLLDIENVLPLSPCQLEVVDLDGIMSLIINRLWRYLDANDRLHAPSRHDTISSNP